jgi:RNA polymerase primary sigma factor
MTEGTISIHDDLSTPLDEFDMFVVDDSESGVDEQTIADNERLVDELASEWVDLTQRSGQAGSRFDDGIEPLIGKDLEDQFREEHQERQRKRRSAIAATLSTALDRGWVTTAELMDIIPNGAATEEAVSELTFHLDAAGVAVIPGAPEEGSEPLETHPCCSMEDMDDEISIAEGIGSTHPVYQPRIGWISSPHDPLRVFLGHIAKRPLLSKYEEIALGRRIVAALRPVEQLVWDHPEILEWPELSHINYLPKSSTAIGSGNASSPHNRGSINTEDGDTGNAGEEALSSKGRTNASADPWTLARAIREASGTSSWSELHARASRTTTDALARAEVLRNTFAESNFKLVFSIATRYQGHGLDIPDLFQEGVIGLMRGIERWDPEKGWKLSTYATWWIRQSVTRALADKGCEIRIPVHMAEKLSQVLGTRRALERQLGRTPSTDEIARALGTSAASVTHTLGMRRTVVDIADLDPGSRWLQEGDSTFSSACQGNSTIQVDTVLSSLNEREAEVIRLRFGISTNTEHTLEEVGRQFGVTRERVRQIEKKALTKLRHPSRVTSLAELLDSLQ